MATRQARTSPIALIALVGALALLATGCDWLQYGGGPTHSNVASETTIGSANVASLHQRFRISLPDRADGEPVVVSGVATPSGTRDLVIVTTTSGTLAAYDAKTGAGPIWQADHPAGGCQVNGNAGACYTTSSPAVDPNRQWVYTYGLDGKVHRHAIGTGAESTTGGWPVTATRKGYDEKGSSALAIATFASTSYLYVTNSGYPGDHGDYQGHVTAVNLATGAHHTFNVLCSNLAGPLAPAASATPADPDCTEVQAGVWARGAVTADTDTGRIYLSTGNATWNPAAHHWGDSVLALNPDGTGSGGGPIDAYTPSNQQQMNVDDVDLGSTAPAVVPSPPGAFPHLGVQGGKDGLLRLLNLDDLSRQGGPGHLGGAISIAPVATGGEVMCAPTTFTGPDGHPWVAVTTTGGTSAYRVVVAPGGSPSLQLVWSVSGPAGEGSPLLAGGVLFVPSDHAIVALDVATGSPRWFAPIDTVHWQAPVIANGVLYQEDDAGALTAWSIPG